ncbi:MAG: GFA family protein [Devosia sp.]
MTQEEAKIVKLPDFPVEGGCQCGAVRYQLEASPLAVYACHCKDCQRFSGTTHTLSMVVRADTVKLTKGSLTGFAKAADSGRTVRMLGCAQCGTKVWNEPLSSPDLIIMKPGTLDDLSWAKPIGNIWTDRKVPWVEIDPDVPNFPGQPPSRQPLIDAWQAAAEAGEA